MFKTKKQIILEEINNGLHPTVISEKYGFSLGSLYYHMKTLGIESNFGKQDVTKKKYSNRMKLIHSSGLSSGVNHWSDGKLKVRQEYVPESEVKEELEYYLTLDLTIKQMSELMAVDSKSITNRLHRFGLQQGRRSGNRHPDWRGGHSRYRGEDWYAQRHATIKRDNYTCQICGVTIDELESSQYMHVHHIVPYRLTQDNSLDNLITLCASCHNKEEAKIEE